MARGTGSSPAVNLSTESENLESALIAYMTSAIDRQDDWDAVPEPIELTPSMRIETCAYERAESGPEGTLCGLGPSHMAIFAA